MLRLTLTSGSGDRGCVLVYLPLVKGLTLKFISKKGGHK